MNKLKSFAYAVMGFRFGSRALGNATGTQLNTPTGPLVEGSRNLGPDQAMQIAAVWRCVEIISSIVAMLPLFTYKRLSNGMRELARGEELYGVLHDSPNGRMTKFEF